MDGTWSSFATSSKGAGMPSGEAPRLRVVAGGGLSGGAISGVRLRVVGASPRHEDDGATAHRERALGGEPARREDDGATARRETAPGGDESLKRAMTAGGDEPPRRAMSPGD